MITFAISAIAITLCFITGFFGYIYLRVLIDRVDELEREAKHSNDRIDQLENKQYLIINKII